MTEEPTSGVRGGSEGRTETGQALAAGRGERRREGGR